MLLLIVLLPLQLDIQQHKILLLSIRLQIYSYKLRRIKIRRYTITSRKSSSSFYPFIKPVVL
jgi:hypothetical protein